MPLFGNRLAFVHTLELIQKHSKRMVCFDSADSPQQILPGGFRSPGGSSVMDAFGSVLPPTIVPSQPIGYTVSITSDPKKLDVYFNMVQKGITSKFEGREIRSIEVIESDVDSKATFMINENPEHCLKLKPKNYWEKLVDVAKDGSTHSNNARAVADYFNSNDKCPLYTKTKRKNFGYTLTRLLVVDNDTLRPALGVRIEIKTRKSIAQRKKKTA